MTQFYLIKVQKLMTSDDCDIVPGWSAHVAEDDLSGLTLSDVAKLLTMQVEGAPVENLRPMTEDEIKEWRVENLRPMTEDEIKEWRASEESEHG